MAFDSTLSALVKQLISGDTTAFYPLYDHLLERNDPRFIMFNNWFYDCASNPDQVQYLHTSAEHMWHPIKQMFCVELLMADGKSPQQLLDQSIANMKHVEENRQKKREAVRLAREKKKEILREHGLAEDEYLDDVEDGGYQDGHMGMGVVMRNDKPVGESSDADQ